MLPVSVCIIMKDEEANLSGCLDAVIKFGFELILVDTGSSDNTISIARKYTNTIYTFDWTRDFSAARNFSLSLANNDWVLVLDCDEIITSLDVESLCSFMNDYPYGIGLITRHNHYEMNGTDSVYIDRVERFFNRNYYHYEGKIHEQVVPLTSPSINDFSGSYPISLEIDHSGYTGSYEELYGKSLRNAELLLEMLEDNPNDPYLYFQMGQCYNMLHDDEKALFYYEKGLSFDVDPAAEYVQMMVIGYGYASLHLNLYEKALSLEGIYDAFAVSSDFFCLMGLIYLRTGSLIRAMAEFLKAISCPVFHTQGSNSFIPYYNMGCINELMGDSNMALSLYQKCGNFPMALTRIKEIEKG